VRSLATAFVAGLVWASIAAGQEAGIVVAEAFLPPAGAAYHGGTHVFQGGEARLTCSSHGVFSGSVTPPRAPGTTSVVDYQATFRGELSLGPAADATTYSVAAPVHMAERLTFGEHRGDTQTLETEMIALEFRGGGMPDGILVRESPSRPSSGRATITTLGRGRQRIEARYDVWLELSRDGGRSWIPAEAAVRMTLAPEPARARLAPGR
jgi:hypothetical protein